LQERFCLEDDSLEVRSKANKCLNTAARRIVKDMMSVARIQLVILYYKKRKGQKMSKKLGASKIYLQEDEYLLGQIDWLNKADEAFKWLCKHWASAEFITKSEKKRLNREASGEVSHRYGVDGHLGLAQRMVSIVLVVLRFLNQVANFSLQEAESGVAPSDLLVFIRGHRGSNPEAPDELCSQAASASVVSIVLKNLCTESKITM
jgi:hypothetical protein